MKSAAFPAGGIHDDGQMFTAALEPLQGFLEPRGFGQEQRGTQVVAGRDFRRVFRPVDQVAQADNSGNATVDRGMIPHRQTCVLAVTTQRDDFRHRRGDSERVGLLQRRGDLTDGARLVGGREHEIADRHAAHIEARDEW